MSGLRIFSVFEIFDDGNFFAKHLTPHNFAAPGATPRAGGGACPACKELSFDATPTWATPPGRAGRGKKCSISQAAATPRGRGISDVSVSNFLCKSAHSALNKFKA